MPTIFTQEKLTEIFEKVAEANLLTWLGICRDIERETSWDARKKQHERWKAERRFEALTTKSITIVLHGIREAIDLQIGPMDQIVPSTEFQLRVPRFFSDFQL
jgi:hypothetical protein